MGVEVNNDPPLDTSPTLQDHRRFKSVKDVPPDATIQFLKPSIMSYVIKLPTPFYSRKDLDAYCVGG
jgi:hypothetical protein